MVLKFENNQGCAISWKSKEEKTAIQLLKDFFLWLRQKSDYMKLRGDENIKGVGIDVSVNKFRKGGEVAA